MSVSIILPVYNAEEWLDECLQSVHDQTFSGKLELSVYDDNSTDRGSLLLAKWRPILEGRQIKVVITGPELSSKGPRGVGFARNRAIEESRGDFLCFLDADDVMQPERIEKQLEVAMKNQDALVGSCFHRHPPKSTERFTKWANRLTKEQLYTQIYTSHGPTIIMPTWFCSKKTFKALGPWDESGKGCPEDLLYFYKHVSSGRPVIRLPDDLLLYRYHPGAATFSVKEDTIWRIRLIYLEEQVLGKWTSFTIWNAGKQGRKFYRSLKEENRTKVSMFCDVDAKKIAKQHYTFEEYKGMPKPKIPIVHFKNARPPFIICVKQDLTGGAFEENLSSLNLIEGVDYFHFN